MSLYDEMIEAEYMGAPDRRRDGKVAIDANDLRRLILCGNIMNEYNINEDSNRAWEQMVERIRGQI